MSARKLLSPSNGVHWRELYEAALFETDQQKLSSRIAEAEQELRNQCAMLEDPVVMGDPTLLRAACIRIEGAQKAIDDLYARWVDLEQKNG